ncbi:RluA family pseudouridine synthase [Mycoplasmoides fastidiosum]|uniref:Pseudouridine synthase n=1 Tax=Mycoplasmoides fastidiosum TaxID=92758 RepID=A0ABU0M046_9BACT|nr:RluA family pseudouridine synthase [Mycoplasmoides fastidiosum]MDQ0514328.1 RluA family pseudouridine synthase [Mycoplasmoides fastidiosum]UUD38069.1 RluA family pseudouridine synthase [Mycoplasmoides fastidiosum]
MNNSTTKKLQKIHHTVQADFAGYRLDKIFRLLQPQWSKVFLYKLINKKTVLVNHKRTRANYHLQAGDVISYYGAVNVQPNQEQVFNHKQLQKLPPLNVVYEDEYVIIVNKPAKVPVQPSLHKKYDTMNNRLLNHLNFDATTQKFKPVFIHRLDMNTTGLLIGAKTYQAYHQLVSLLKNQQIIKSYHCLVWGQVSPDKQELQHYLFKDATKNRSFVVHAQHPGAKLASSLLQLEQVWSQQSLVQVTLKTGRTHQIRVQLSHLHYPICGDRKYGMHPQNKLFPTQALVASGLVFQPTEWTKELQGLKKRFQLFDHWFTNPKYIL